MSSENYYKILLLGDGKVGKSSLFIKYVTGEFKEEYNENKAFQNQKIVTSLNGETMKIQIYDPPENIDKHKLYTSIYLKINCIIVLFDITNKNSFENAFNKWIPHFFNNKQNQKSQSIPVIILGNFKDKASSKAVLEEDIKAKIKEAKKFTDKCKYKEISVKNDDISALFNKILNFIIKNNESSDENKDNNGNEENNKSIDKNILNKVKNKINSKVILLGDAKVGKTSIINRYIDNQFSDEYIQTISDDNRAKDIFFSSKQIHELYKGMEEEEILKKMPKELYEEDAVIQMDLWDNPGQEDVHNFNRNYYKHATCCILVFDLCDRVTFEQVINWRNNFLQYLKIISIPNEYETRYYDIIEEIPFILVGNKTDSEERDITAEEIEEFLEENKNEIKCYNEISVKENIGLEELFENVSKYSFEFKVNEIYGNRVETENKSYNINENNENIEENYKKSNNNDINNNDEDEYDIFGRSKKERLKAEKEEKERKEREDRELLEQEERERKEREEKERKEREEREEKERIEKEEREKKEREEKERKEKEENERLEKERKEKEELEILLKIEQEENERREREEIERREREERESKEKEEKERIEKEEKEKRELEEKIRLEKEEREKKEKEEKDRLEKEERVKKEKEEKDRLEKEERVKKEKEEKDRLEKEERVKKEIKEKEEIERKEKERIQREKEEKEKSSKEIRKIEIIEKETQTQTQNKEIIKESKEKAENNSINQNNNRLKENNNINEELIKNKELSNEIKEKINNSEKISLIFELEKYFINKDGNPTQFVIEEKKEKVFIQIVNTLFNTYPCLNSIKIKSFENKSNDTEINYYSNCNDNILNNNSIIVIKLE